MKWIQVNMLLKQLSSARYPTSAEECAGLLGMSVSTLKKDIIELRHLLSQYGCTIVGKRGQGNGYELKISDDSKFSCFMNVVLPEEIAQENMDFNEQKNRVRYLVERFLDAGDFIRADQLAEELSISRSQFNKDFVLAKRIFAKFDIHLINRPHYGLKTEGDEKSVRICLASIYMQNWGLNEEHKIYIQPDVNNHILYTIKEIVMNCAAAYQYKLTDALIQNLVVHLFVSVKRLQSGHCMELDEETIEKLLDSKEREIAQRIVSDVGEMFGVIFNEQELSYIVMHLSAKRVIEDDYLLNEQVMEIVDSMLIRIKERYFIDLTGDLDLRISLGMHTIPLMKRVQYGMVLRNPVLDEIRKKLVFAYEVALCGCGVINEMFDCALSADEVGYYAMALKLAMDGLRESEKKNILLVCSSGRGSAQLLRFDFEKKYGEEIKRLDTCNVFELEQMELSDYDCIFTTVPIRLPFPIPIFKIKLFLDEESEMVIDRALKSGRQSHFAQTYFPEELFCGRIKGTDKQEVIQQIVARISRIRELPEGFYEAVMAREKLESTQLSPYAAMPHPDRVLTECDIISLNVLEKAVDWGNGEIQVVLLCSFSKEFVRHNEAFFKFVLEFIHQKQAITRLIQHPTYETIKQIIDELSREDT